MRIRLYWDIVWFGFRQVAVYRSEVWVAIITKIIRLAGVIFLWSVILKDPAVGHNFSTLLPYFLVADSIQVLVGGEWIRFGRQIIDEIKSGAINNHLLKPVHPIAYLYARFTGGRAIEISLSIITLTLGWILFPPASPVSILFFLLAVLISVAVSFAFNVMVGNLAFWFTEADGIKNGVSHIIRVFGGSMIPINFFSGYLKTLINNSPLPIFAFLPASILQQGLGSENLRGLVVSLLWATALIPISLMIWRKGVRRCEAIGI